MNRGLCLVGAKILEVTMIESNKLHRDKHSFEPPDVGLDAPSVLGTTPTQTRGAFCKLSDPSSSRLADSARRKEQPPYVRQADVNCKTSSSASLDVLAYYQTQHASASRKACHICQLPLGLSSTLNTPRRCFCLASFLTWFVHLLHHI